jgi:hypothetical protein
MIGGGKDFFTGKNVSALLSRTVSGLNSASKSTLDRNSRLIGNLGNRNNTFLKGSSDTHWAPWADTTPVDRSDLAHDIVTSAEVERAGPEMIILD